MLLNDDKTQIIQLGQKSTQVENPLTLAHLLHILPQISRILVSTLITVSSLIRQKKMNTIVSTSFIIHRLAKVKPFLNRKGFETAISHVSATEILCMLGYPLFHFAPSNGPKCAAARLLIGSRKREHITPILCTLY